MRPSVVIFSIPALLAMSAAAHADVVISSGMTANMSCSGGVCSPTAKNAVLNVTDLQNLLASGNVKVTTTGSGVQAGDIKIGAPFTWSNASGLALDAYQSITINKAVSVTGTGGLALTTNDGGSGGALSFGPKGDAIFQNSASPLTINGVTYTLVNSVQSLAGAIAANPSGAFALANNYDATPDGTYSEAPIQTDFRGSFEGLGNAITNLSINGSGNLGLFIGDDGPIENLSLLKINIALQQGVAGGVAAAASGTMTRVRATGTIRGPGSQLKSIGGLVGFFGVLVDCSSDVRITADGTSYLGGLVSQSGSITRSFAIGSVTATSAGSIVGGIISENSSKIQDSYSTGAVSARKQSEIGGFVGANDNGGEVGSIATSYSIGAVSQGEHVKMGGFAGRTIAARHAKIQQSYWDTTTSGTSKATGKGGANGITGLTTDQLQSALPKGFDPKVWAENPKINDGFPYLIDNPPQN
ncbi:MAG TPA: hypothetical protein VGK90_00600 [Rhizomicrobium sp.]|jgi:hypothetical protein